MPKRRSLVGTGREAMGDSPKARETARTAVEPVAEAPKKPRRAAPKLPKEPAREAPAAVAPPAPQAVSAEPDHRTGSSAGTLFEAMLGFANAALRQNLETGARLARCTSPQEVVAAHTAHAAALTQSFVAASLKLMQAGLPAAPWALWKPRTDAQ